MQVMQISIEESTHAFRVNGVTLAKRHLKASMPKGDDDEKRLARYLTIVPFLHEAYVPREDAPESIKYGAYKAHRLYEALGLTHDIVAPFMLMCMTQSGDLPTSGNFAETAAPFQQREQEDETRTNQTVCSENVIQFPTTQGRKVTIH